MWWHEGQRCRAAGQGAQRVGDPGGLDVDQVVAEAALVAGAAVVHFIGVEHDDLAGQAAFDGAAIVEGLDAEVGDADGVAVVAMRGVAGAGELGAQQLDAVDERAVLQPVARRARSFKTVAPGCRTILRGCRAVRSG